jgi:hypothetical protein
MEVSTPHVSHSSQCQLLGNFQHTMFVHAACTGSVIALILFTKCNYTFEAHQVTNKLVLHSDEVKCFRKLVVHKSTSGALNATQGLHVQVTGIMVLQQLRRTSAVGQCYIRGAYNVCKNISAAI